MKRLAILCAIALPLFGLTKLPSPGDRIGVLRISGDPAGRAGQTVVSAIEHDLRGELQERGFKAFDTRVTLDEARSDGAPAADYYVEVVSSGAANGPLGGFGALGPVAVDVGVVVSRVAAELRLYDGRTLALIDRFDLQAKSTAVVPTGVGVGARPFWFMIALPFVHYGQYRSAAHEVARRAADLIAQR